MSSGSGTHCLSLRISEPIASGRDRHRTRRKRGHAWARGPYAVAMDRPAPPSPGLGTRVVVGIVALVVIWIVVRLVLGTVFAVIRSAVFVVLFAIVAWVVLVGPPGRRD
jgi:hypothetical protein